MVAQVTFSGIPAWLLVTYLVELGGAQDEEGTVRGDGWTARLVSRTAQLGGLVIGRVTVTIEGRAAEETMAGLRKKAQRGGG
jgi:hypothetical protein